MIIQTQFPFQASSPEGSDRLSTILIVMVSIALTIVVTSIATRAYYENNKNKITRAR